MLKTYYVCFDTCGNGFEDIEKENKYAFNEEELKCCIGELKARGIEDDRICIFELTDKRVETKHKKYKKILEEWEINII